MECGPALAEEVAVTVLAFAQLDLELLSAPAPVAGANAASGGFLELIESSFAEVPVDLENAPLGAVVDEPVVPEMERERASKPKEVSMKTRVSEGDVRKTIVFPVEYFYPMVPVPPLEAPRPETPSFGAWVSETGLEEAGLKVDDGHAPPAPPTPVMERPLVELLGVPLVDEEPVSEARTCLVVESVPAKREREEEYGGEISQALPAARGLRVREETREFEAGHLSAPPVLEPLTPTLPAQTDERWPQVGPAPVPTDVVPALPRWAANPELTLDSGEGQPAPRRVEGAEARLREGAEAPPREGAEAPLRAFIPSRSPAKEEETQPSEPVRAEPHRLEAEMRFAVAPPPPSATTPFPAAEPRVERLHAPAPPAPVREASGVPPHPAVRIQIPLEDGREVRAEIVATPAALHVKMQAPDPALQAEIGRHAPELRTRLEEIQRESPASAATWETSRPEGVTAVEGARFEGVSTGEGESGARSPLPFEPASDQDESRGRRRRSLREFFEGEEENQ